VAQCRGTLVDPVDHVTLENDVWPDEFEKVGDRGIGASGTTGGTKGLYSGKVVMAG